MNFNAFKTAIVYQIHSAAMANTIVGTKVTKKNAVSHILIISAILFFI